MKYTVSCREYYQENQHYWARSENHTYELTIRLEAQGWRFHLADGDIVTRHLTPVNVPYNVYQTREEAYDAAVQYLESLPD